MQKWLFVGVMAVFLILVEQGGFLDANSGDFGVPPKSPEFLTPANPSTPPVDMFTVVRIVDGDTIVVSTKGVQEKIRLIGVDTPETVDPRKPVQCFGKEASDFTKGLLLGVQVKLESDDSQSDRDKYGRLLRYVFLSDGTLVNQKIISEGYGHKYTYRTPYKYQNEFKDTEHTARENQKGLWADNVCGVQNII